MTPHPARRPVAALAALAAVLALTLGLGASPAGAHSGAGTLTVEAAHPVDPLSVHYIVLLTWDNDGHPAEDATVTATPVAADGTAQTPYTLAPSGAGDGRYSGAVEFPEAGEWTVRLTSIEPTGTLELTETVVAPTTTAGAASGDGDSASATTVAGGAFAPADDGTGDSAAASDDDEDSGSGSIPVLLVVGAAIVAIGGAVTAVLAARRNGPGSARAAGGATDRPTATPAGQAGGDTPATTPAGAAGEPARDAADDPTSP